MEIDLNSRAMRVKRIKRGKDVRSGAGRHTGEPQTGICRNRFHTKVSETFLGNFVNLDSFFVADSGGFLLQLLDGFLPFVDEDVVFC